MAGEDLTPSQDLFMEVLSARYRTGERLWTFETRHAKTSQVLEAKGLITTMHGIVEKTFRASLTEAGRSLYLDSEYESPIERKLKQKKGRGQKW